VKFIFNEITLLENQLAEKEKGNSIKNHLKSNYLPRTRFLVELQPTHFASLPLAGRAANNFAT